MTRIAESNGMLGPAQFGFRKRGSTLDAIFVLATPMMKAKSKKYPYTVAFIDIAKVRKH